MHVEVVIPAYQPDERLSRYVADLKAAGFTAITVVDDGGGCAGTGRVPGAAARSQPR